MINEGELAQEIEKQVLGKPTLKAVSPPREDADRTTKQMYEQFQKIQSGLESDLARTEAELQHQQDRVDDLVNALRVIRAAIVMLDK